jgi:hypothetical protein
MVGGRANYFHPLRCRNQNGVGPPNSGSSGI